ncbi:MFS transporter [Sphingomonas morindae]|uniref:MFS transporter n=1 Tax=Sphingomonas morindae TaxID=1541170 RepID=A0ABY4XDH5_9SPHN|nr:MFS transporter [Sphingomonas morindae]USI74816.1 MFS transporter [Sphingomonas morindae]
MSSPPRRADGLALLAYASGNFGKNVLASTFDFFLLYLLTARWSVAPAAAGLVVMLGLVWDGAANPLLGRLMDRAGGGIDGYRRALLLGAPAVGLAFAIFFLAPDWPAGAMLAWALLLTLAFRTAFSWCDVAHNALIVPVARGHRATLVSGLRYLFSCLGALAIARVATPFLQTDHHATRATLGIAALAALAYVGTLWLSVLFVRAAPIDTAPPHPALAATIAPGRGGDAALISLLALAFLQALTLPLFVRSLAFIAADLLHRPAWLGLALTLFSLAQAAALPGWMLLARRLATPAALALAFAIAALAFAVAMVAPAALLLAIGLFGIGNAGIQMLIWALLPAAVERAGPRREAFSVALFLLALKAGGGLSGALLGLVLSVLGWRAAGGFAAGAGGLFLAITCLVPLTGALLCLPLLRLHARIGAAPARRQAAPAGRVPHPLAARA